MNDPSHGYDTSVGYTFGFYREMAPGWLDLCVRSAGREPARCGGAFRYLELGCGQGFGLCLLAAAHGAAYEHLAASHLGSAIRVSRMELMLLDTWAEAQSDPGAIADGVWERMSRRGQKLYHHGRVVDDAVAADRLRTVAGRFIEDILPRWRQLGVVE